MARSNAALRRPPVKELPSTPAGVYVDDATELLGVVVEHERRRGRGAESNASGRYEPLARIAFDDGWRSLDELPPFKTEVTVDATRKIITRNELPGYRLRPLDQSLSRLRARLRLLLRPADPRLSGAVAGARLRDPSCSSSRTRPSLLERELAAPGYQPKSSRSAPIPTPISRSSGATRSCAASSKCSTAPAIRSASSPSRRWCCATSTSCRAWPSASWPRSRCR